MSTLTTEWQLKTGENSIKYTVVVENFRQKIATFKAGRSIWSKDFKVGRSVFCLSIYPSGEKRNSTYVSVYLYNKSDWDVFADLKFEVGDCKYELSNKRFGTANGDEHHDNWGFAKLVPHHRCNNGDLLVDGGCFQLEVFIDVDDEQVLPDHNVEDEAISKMKSLDQKLDQKFEAMKKMIENKFTAMDQRLATIEAGKFNMFNVFSFLTSSC